MVEHNLAKVGVASSSLVFRSKVKTAVAVFFYAVLRIYLSNYGSPAKSGGLCKKFSQSIKEEL